MIWADQLVGKTERIPSKLGAYCSLQVWTAWYVPIRLAFGNEGRGSNWRLRWKEEEERKSMTGIGDDMYDIHLLGCGKTEEERVKHVS